MSVSLGVENELLSLSGMRNLEAQYLQLCIHDTILILLIHDLLSFFFFFEIEVIGYVVYTYKALNLFTGPSFTEIAVTLDSKITSKPIPRIMSD